MTGPLTGGCACGAVRFEAAGEPVHAAYCHCVDCRRASGAPVVAWIGFSAERVAVSGPLVRRATRGAVRRGFCSECGGALTYEDGDIPERELYVAAGALDAPDSVRPNAHAYWSERIGWLELEDDLPKFAGTTRRRNGASEPTPLA